MSKQKRNKTRVYQDRKAWHFPQNRLFRFLRQRNTRRSYYLYHHGLFGVSKGNILKPEYGVKTLLELFALADADIDEVLQGLPLAKRKVLKALIKQDR